MTESSAIDVPDEDACAFCDYLSGRRAYTILERSPLTALLVTREQRGVSHLLVVTARHVPTLLDVSNEESDALMVAVRRAARAIDSADERPGIAVWQNNGIPANQAIGHLHFHVAGTLAGGGTEFGEVRELSMAETDAIAAHLAPFLV